MTDKSKKKKVVKAKPDIAENIGYLHEGKRNAQVKIATSNLFIETGVTQVDYMDGAIFEGIGGNEFINDGGADVILQNDNTSIKNASEIREAMSTIANEKQPNGTDLIMSQFPIRIKDYIPKTIDNKTYIGKTGASGVNVYVQFPEQNVYFDPTYTYIYIELENLADDEEIDIEFIKTADVSSAII